MIVIIKGDYIFVIGVSGYIVFQIVKEFFKEGYRVRGIVRFQDKGEYFKQLFEGFGVFDYVIVEDIIKVSGFCFDGF